MDSSLKKQSINTSILVDVDTDRARTALFALNAGFVNALLLALREQLFQLDLSLFSLALQSDKKLANVL